MYVASKKKTHVCMADKVDTRPLASTDRQIKNKTKR